MKLYIDEKLLTSNIDKKLLRTICSDIFIESRQRIDEKNELICDSKNFYRIRVIFIFPSIFHVIRKKGVSAIPPRFKISYVIPPKQVCDSSPLRNVCNSSRKIRGCSSSPFLLSNYFQILTPTHHYNFTPTS